MRLGLGLLLASVSVAAPSTLPVLSSLNFDLADVLGGDSITITGLLLGSATSCTVGGTTSTITGNTSTSLTFTMPAKAAGTYNVQVTTAAGSSNTLTIEAWAPSSEATTTLFCEQPNYVVATGTGTWTSRVGSNLTESIHPPVAASGYPDFAGAAAEELIGPALNTLVGSASGSVFAVIDLDTAPAPAGGPYDDPAIVEQLNDASVIMAVNSTGLIVGCYNSGYSAVQLTGSLTGAKHVTQMRWTSTGPLLEGAVDGGAWTTLAASPAVTATVMKIGGSYNNAHMSDGRIRAVFFCTAKITDAFATKFYKWAKARHGVA